MQEFISAENLFEFPEEKKKESLKRPAAQPADEQAPPAKKTRKINGPEDLSVETRRAILITLPKVWKFCKIF